MRMPPHQIFREALAAHQSGRRADAESLYRQVLSVEPYHADALHGLGLLIEMPKADGKAGCLLKAAVVVDCSTARFYHNFGNILLGEGRYQEAEISYCRAIRLAPGRVDTHRNLANVLQQKRELTKAINIFYRILILAPDKQEDYSGLGDLLRRTKRLPNAVMAFHHALWIDPLLVPAFVNLGNALREEKRFGDAALSLRQGLAVAPGQGALLGSLGEVFQEDGQLVEAAQCFERALAIKPDDLAALESLRVCAAYRDDLDDESVNKIYRRFEAEVARSLPVVRPVGILHPQRPRRRIGYLSSDLRNHPVGNSMLPVIGHHDRRIFEVHFYADIQQPDLITDAFRAAADGWHEIGDRNDLEVADLIRRDEIDILVCLAGRFDSNRVRLATQRAAPIQISLHDVATSALKETDYLIGDRWLLPRHNPEYFTERLLRLPQFYLGSLPSSLPDIETVEPSGPPVFGCFNNPSKISPSLLNIWGTILSRMPDCRLRLKYLTTYRDRSIQERLLKALVMAGAKASQVDFVVGTIDSNQQILSRYNQVDVALDTFPFSGSTTSFQALIMGVPVITWPWQRMVSRWTAAMLKGVGLSELIADSAENYVNIAIRTLEQRVEWRSRRLEIRQRAQTKFCNAAAWARHLERLYNALWRCRVAEQRMSCR